MLKKKKERETTESSWATRVSPGAPAGAERRSPSPCTHGFAYSFRVGICPAALAILKSWSGRQPIPASQPQQETAGPEAPSALVPWHIWKLLVSTPFPPPPLCSSCSQVANSGKYPSAVLADDWVGEGGSLSPCRWGKREVGRLWRVNMSHPRRAGLLLP